MATPPVDSAPVGVYRRGDILLVEFPTSSPHGGSSLKRRPALVLSLLPLQTVPQSFDYLLCMITSRIPPDPLLLPIPPQAIRNGILTATQSYLRPCYTHSVGDLLIIRKIAELEEALVDEAARRLVAHVGASIGTAGTHL
jgi:mRNA-degrading endonuclease toxin of MazEF toxin-antitoxin module